MKLNPADYDYLWTDYEVNYIFTSCYLFTEFRKSDIVLIYDHEAKGLHFFLSKKDRERFANYGIRFYDVIYPKWEIETKKIIADGNALLKNIRKEDASVLEDKDIKKRILELTGLFHELGNKYFYTEFFFIDKVDKIIYEKSNKNISRNAARIGKIKFEARIMLNELYNYDRLFKKYISEIERRKGRNDLQWLSYKEIINVIDNKNIPASSRDKTDWILTKNNGWKIIEGRTAEKTKKNFENLFFNSKTNNVIGTAADKGIYKGTAKVIRTVFSDNVGKEILKVKKGDILVANTTGPELMAACQRAGAIVTDEGGLTSHAAIISRELGIPCIVGTKIATKIFKDNDTLEVDANKGTVKKLK